MYLVLVESSICKQTKIKVDITCLFTVVKKELELRCPINPLMIGQITCVFGKVGHVYIVQLVCANKNKMYRGAGVLVVTCLTSLAAYQSSLQCQRTEL